MARVQYGVIVTELKGAIGGSIFQRGNNSMVLKNKGYRKGTSSLSRQLANVNITSQAFRWRLISDANKAAWVAIQEAWTFTDKFGNTYIGSAYQIFVSYNSLLLTNGQTVLSAPNTVYLYTTLVFNRPEWSLAIGLSISWTILAAQSQFVQVYMSPPMSQGRSINNCRYKLVGVVDSSILLEYDTTAVYIAFFGMPSFGSKIAVKLVSMPDVYPRVQQTYIDSLVVGI